MFNRSIKEWKKDHNKQKIDCACRGKHTNSHKAKHKKTTMHKKYLNSLNH